MPAGTFLIYPDKPMKRLGLYLGLLIFPFLVACNEDDDSIDYSKYYGWRDKNDALFDRLSSYLSTESGNAYFHDSILSLSNAECVTFYRVLRSANEDSLRAIGRWYTPYYTSNLRVHYTLYDTKSVMDLLPADAADFNSPAIMDSIFFDSSVKADTLQSMQVTFYENFTCGDVVAGWGDVLQNMHIGDCWLVAIPWQCGYGMNGKISSGIDPYSSLFFRIELYDIIWWGGTVRKP